MASAAKADVLRAVLPPSPHLEAVIQHVARGPSTRPAPNCSPALLSKANLASRVSDLTQHHAFATKQIVSHPQVETLRDAAYHFNTEATQHLANLAEAAGEQPVDIVALQRGLFQAEPTAVLNRMVDDDKINMPSDVKSGVSRFLVNHPSLNMRQSSVAAAAGQPGALQGIPASVAPQVVDTLKTMQRVQALAPDPETVQVLLNNGVTSAHQTAQMSKGKFVKKFQESLGKPLASSIHDHASSTTFRNDSALLQIYQTVKGTGLAVIDGQENIDTRMATFLRLADKYQAQIDLESMFGGMDYCECDDCTTVISPANYYVDLLQYLRNNDLDPATDSSGNLLYPDNGTALDVLLKRRPDLQHLELTCENANTLIPYIDLANEVMESFVVHLDTYPTAWSPTAQSKIDVFNVTDETSAELIAEPQHTNYKAYCILRQAVFPLGALPFHQPITAMRIYFNFLKTSRYEIMDIFRKPYVTPAATPPFSLTDDQKLCSLHEETLTRATDAEYLKIIQEEYIIITKEAFWPIEYFNITTKSTNGITEAQYQHVIGVRDVWKYWGYASELEMLDDKKSDQEGLQFVKAQFLTRSDMQYPQLVKLIKTTYVNPVYPTGKALVILDSIRFSFRFLQTLVDKTAKNKKDKFKLLIRFLIKFQPWAKDYIKTRSVDQKKMCLPNICDNDICDFVYQWFDCLAKLVVLESGEGPTLPVQGAVTLFAAPAPPPLPSPKIVVKDTIVSRPQISSSTSSMALILPAGYTRIGTLYSEGTITNNLEDDGTGEPQGQVMGTVAIDSVAYTVDGKLFANQYSSQGQVEIVSAAASTATTVVQEAFIDTDSTLKHVNSEGFPGETVLWNAVVDSCNIDSVRILHLDGTNLTTNEWDRIQRFIRLWKRLGWTIDEMDKALAGLAEVSTTTSTPSQAPNPNVPRPDPIIGSGDFASETCAENPEDEDCDCKKNDKYCQCHDECIPDDICKSIVPTEITPGFLKELVPVSKLQSLTGINRIQLLAFWADISTAGGKSLYSQLFLTYDLIGLDGVFAADDDGIYLSQPTPISDHLPVIMAALHLNQTSLDAILTFANLSTAELTLSNISKIYRISLLAQTLATKVQLLIEAIGLFGDPFIDAQTSLNFVRRFNGVINAGFTIQQLTYLVLGTDDPINPLGPNVSTILQTTKTFSDGLNALDASYPDVTTEVAPVITTVTQNTTLFFDPTLVLQINELLQGTTSYSTNAPTGLKITIPSSLNAKISYYDPTTVTGTNRVAQLTCVGILTPSEILLAKGLSADPRFSDAIDRVGKQAITFYNNNIMAIFPNQSEAMSVLLAGDVIAPVTIQPPPNPDPDTAPVKIAYFLKYFMPYLRDQLADQLIISTMAGQANISSDITSALMTNILKISGAIGSQSQSALAFLKSLRNPSSNNTGGWSGYLIPSTTDTYTFIGIGDTQPVPLKLDGLPQAFKYQQDDPNNVWLSDPITLTGGRLYLMDSGGQSVPGLQWKTARSAASVIPSSTLLPNFSTTTVTKVFALFAKAAIVINGFNLSIDEVNYFQSNGTDFGGFDLNQTTLKAWERMLAYFRLKVSLPALSTTLLDLFKWASTVPSTTRPTLADLANQVAAATNWVEADLQTIIGPNCLNVPDASLFKNEVALTKLQTALTVADKVGIAISTLFTWANPMAKFWPSHDIAEDMRNAIRSRYSLSDWEQAAIPLHNSLRMAQRNALVAYLIVQPALNEWGVVDADSLFEFFLIDVQMGACLQTSRLKQAISTVQTFVQRCILGLEEEKYPSVTTSTLDQSRWSWMSKQAIWTANRRVFLTPENYIIESLRDDKSPLYVTLESELMQKDINPSTLRDSIKNYLFSLDQISNLLVEGIFQDIDQTVYFVAKTRSAPYLFFSRTYSISQSSWTPWQPIPVDIPTYHVDAIQPPDPSDQYANEVPANSGSYVIPVVMDSRFIVFFAVITSKSVPQTSLGSVSLTPGGTAQNVARFQTWEIKMGWTELQNGKWRLFLAHQALQGYVQIAVYNAEFANWPPPWPAQTGPPPPPSNVAVGGFEFHGATAFAISTSSLSTKNFSWPARTSFHFVVGQLSTPKIFTDPVIYSLQIPIGGYDVNTYTTNYPYVTYPASKNTSSLTIGTNSVDFYHKFSHNLLSIINSTPDLSTLYSTYESFAKDSTNYPLFGYSGTEFDNGQKHPVYNELATPYALYNWEVAFHAPLELAGSYLQNQQFDNALAMCHNVFNPYASGSDVTRVWQWFPFTQVETVNVLENLFNSLQPNTPDSKPGTVGTIDAWRDNPFAPHVVARQRPVAYMEFTVMTYLQILIAYGDWYFRQNSLEAVPYAIQCYILASHIYGPRAQKIPKRGKAKPQTYFSLLNKWDAFSNAVVDMELTFPFSNQTPHPVEFVGNEIVLANIFGFATTHYFAIPSNSQLTALRDLIDDRLYKIRHCQDINGNAISLALWDPPINPALLVAAVAEGLSLSNFLNDLDAPLPNYRFYFLLQKALELCSEIKSLGSQFLSIKEKRDSEALQLLRAKQDNSIQTLIMQVRTLQLEEASKTLDALRTSRRAPLYRYQYYTSLAGATAAALAETDTDYSEIALSIPAPDLESDLVLTPNEKNEFDEAQNAKNVNDGISALEVFSGLMSSLPGISESAQPWGLGVTVSFGFQNIAATATMQARAMRIIADSHTFSSNSSGRKAGYIKQYQDRVQQANSAGYELLNINSQMVIQQSRIDAANQEITNQQAQINNSAETLEFLTNMYTNDQLYAYLESSVRTLFYQTYTLAYDIAKKAEAAFVFERGPQPNQFIQFGYWDASHDGLMSGERLYLALKQLEAAYQDNRGYDFEVTKQISVRQLNPWALLQLRETGSCQVSLPEVVFDMDFPGHYARRIKTVAVSIPCIVGPYTSISATLRLLQSSYRFLPTVGGANSYIPQTNNGPDPRFQSSNVPLSAIAVSTAQSDSGSFELNLSGERYLPFEGAGAISTWQLDLPDAFRQFDYESINDVILTIRYTSLDGGDKLKGPASASVAAYIKTIENLSTSQGLFALFDLKAEFASGWAQWTSPLPTSSATPPSAGPSSQTLALTNLVDRLPLYTKGRLPSKIIATDIHLATSTALPASAFSLSTDPSGSSDPVTFTQDANGIGGITIFSSAAEVDASFAKPWSLSVQIPQGTTVVWQKVWLLVRFKLT